MFSFLPVCSVQFLRGRASILIWYPAETATHAAEEPLSGPAAASFPGLWPCEEPSVVLFVSPSQFLTPLWFGRMKRIKKRDAWSFTRAEFPLGRNKNLKIQRGPAEGEGVSHEGGRIVFAASVCAAPYDRTSASGAVGRANPRNGVRE